ncbi:MAG TPA: TonB-dependent receptor [Flavipsychrobacter sp.]|nr:TonB-dependent receptor [Flavipsychrobacter sp.]
MKPFFYTFLISLIAFSLNLSAQNIVKGSVTNKTTKEKLLSALVVLKNGNEKKMSATDANGNFVFENVVSGNYQLIVEYIGYDTIAKEIEVENNKENFFAIALTEKNNSLSDVNIFGKIDNGKEYSSRISEKNADNITNVISAEAIQRSPDINAANVLQRMSGITLQKNTGGDESYAIVRGLEPRYNNTLINGVQITSPDEKARSVPLDIIPSDILEKIEISKTLLPEMEGDAIGGTVNMIMKDAPDSTLFVVSAALGYSNIFFHRSFTDFSKSDIQQKSLNERFGSSYVAQPGDFSRTNMEFTDKDAPPNGTATITYGKRFLDNKLGILVADNFQNQYYADNSVFNQIVPDVRNSIPAISDVSNVLYSTQQLNNALTLHADYKINDRNKIIVNNVLIYSQLAQARLSIDTSIMGGNGGRTVPGTGPISTDYLSLTNHELLENLKVEGRHIISNHFYFDWAGIYSDATKRSPDRADISVNKKIDTVHTTGSINGPYTFRITPDYFDDVTRIWQHNDDKDNSALANLSYKNIIGSTLIDLKIGGLYRQKKRYNLQDEYDLRPTVDPLSGIKTVFTNIQDAQWIVYTAKGTYDYDVNDYHAFENVTAGFAQAKISFKKIDLFGGVRTEITDQGFTINTPYPGNVNGVDKNYTDVLPSILFNYKLNSKTNIRLSYFKSISRPNYYELVPNSLPSISSSNTTSGNPFLKHSIADNYDIRYELYPKGEEQLFIGAFYKKIQDPIETAYVGGSDIMPVNNGTATVYGAELVFTKYLGNFGITGNYTFLNSVIYSIKSYTDPLAGTTNTDRLEKRPMQGETNNTVNVSLLYRDRNKRFFAQLAYEYLGKTLSVIYPIYGDDFYQQPESFLSFSCEYALNKHFSVFGKFNNLLNTATYDKIHSLLVTKDVYYSNFLIGFRYVN